MAQETTQPWTRERRAIVKRKIDKEAARAAARLGGTHAILIVVFRDGEYVHVQDGGTSIVPMAKLYRTMLTATEDVAASGGKDVIVQ